MSDTATRAAVARAVSAIDSEQRKTINARDDIAPSGKQRSYIARLTLELMGVPFPESRREAAVLIDRLRGALEERDAPVTAPTNDDIPF